LAVAASAGSPAGADELLGLDIGGFLFPPDLASHVTPPAGTVAGAPPAAGLAVATEPLPTLRLAWVDPASAAALGGASARDEAARVFKTMGIPTSWRRAEAREAARAGEVRVILLNRGALNENHAIVLGATPSHFEDAPLVWIHVPGVLDALGLAGRGPAALGPRDVYCLGIALGRVIAHELVHALAPGLPHGRGLMASRLTRADLLASSMPAAPDVGRAVRGALAGAPVAGRDGGLLAVEHARDER
jgi:hypothetical protein